MHEKIKELQMESAQVFSEIGFLEWQKNEEIPSHLSRLYNKANDIDRKLKSYNQKLEDLRQSQIDSVKEKKAEESLQALQGLFK